MPEFSDPVFAKTSPKRSFLMTDNERFGPVLAKTGSINSDTDQLEDIAKKYNYILASVSCYIT